MRLTKLEHAALVLEEAGHKLFIDPGSFTTPITDAGNASAVVVTHEHADHWTPEQLTRIQQLSPGVPIFGPASFAAAADGFEVTVVQAGDTVEADGFSLQFFGAKHAMIHSSIPLVDNVGVLVNDELYYPGDSFTIPEGVQVDTLAVPSSAPWLKTGEFMDFVLAVQPKRSFPTHEMANSVWAKQMANGRIRLMTEQGGGEFFPLEPGDTLDL